MPNLLKYVQDAGALATPLLAGLFLLMTIGGFIWLYIRSAKVSTQLVAAKYELEQRVTERTQTLRDNEYFLKEAQRIGQLGCYCYDIHAGRWTGSEVLNTIFEIDDSFDHSSEGWYTLVHPDDLTAMKTYLDEVTRDKRESMTTVYRIVCPDSGTVKWIREHGKVSYRDGHPWQIIGTIQDITGSKELENDLREKGDYLKSTLESVDDLVFLLDVDGNYLESELTSHKELLPVPRDELIGKNLREILPNDIAEPAMEIIKSVITTGKAQPFDYSLDVDQAYHSFASNISPWRNRSGAIAGVSVVVRDVTDAKEAEERMRHSQRLESIGQLAGGVAHDFNNMLGGIMGAAEVLSLKKMNDPESERYIQLILDASERASQLTRKLLDFSGKGKRVTRDVDIHTALEDTIHLLERSIDPRIIIVMDFKADTHVVKGDPSQLHNAFLNLAVNARDAMPEGGELTLATTTVYLEKDFCNRSMFSIEPGCFLEVSIRDTGVGIKPELQKQIFDPFFTTKPTGQGTGLGLSAVDGAVKEHRGMVLCTSELGQGSLFKLYLPIAKNDDFRGRDTERLKTSDGDDAQIMVVDDELVVRCVVDAMLKSFGYTVQLALSGAEAIQLYKEHQDEIDLIILDVAMPNMDGRQTFYELKKINPDVKILFSSGFTNETTVSDLIEEGACGFIKKPYRRRELHESVYIALGHLNLNSLLKRK